jgi:hypothetical protein
LAVIWKLKFWKEGQKGKEKKKKTGHGPQTRLIDWQIREAIRLYLDPFTV